MGYVFFFLLDILQELQKFSVYSSNTFHQILKILPDNGC